MLSLRLELLTGRYAATQFNDRQSAEWPPHPARIFSALVAAHYEAGDKPEGREALEWLQAQPPPAITFSRARPRSVKTHFVPVNDRALSDGGRLSTAWEKLASAKAELEQAAGRDGVAPKELAKLQRQHAKAESALAESYRRAGARSANLPKDAGAQAQHVLPSGRARQARTFPVVVPDEPVVWLTWPDRPPRPVEQALHHLAEALVRVGHSSSFVAAQFTSEAPLPTWVPREDGPHVLRGPAPDQLARLDRLHELRPFGEQRVLPYRSVRYGEVVAGARPAHPSGWASRFIVFRRLEGQRLPIQAGLALATAIRGALLSHAGDDAPAYLTGHHADGSPTRDAHLAVVPLPFVGHRRARGELLGVALIAPRDVEEEYQRALFRTIGLWEAAHRTDVEAYPRLPVAMGRIGQWWVERCVDIPPILNLQESVWCRAATRWASATPVVLDRFPGDLNDRKVSRREKAYRKARDTITRACKHAGLPAPRQIELSMAPVLPGSEAARSFPSYPDRGAPRVRVHAVIEFDGQIEGPVLIGAGRHRGLGLFRPIGGFIHG